MVGPEGRRDLIQRRVGAVRPFDAEVARRYEAWFKGRAGRRAEAEERAMLERLLEWIGHPASALEVGCGTGRFTRWLAGGGIRIVGLDRSPAMLAEARARAPAIPFVLGDAHALPFATAAFDVAIFVTTLEFLADPVAALGEAARVARRGLILGVLNRWSLAGLRRLLRRSSLRAAGRLLRPAELRRLVRQALGDRLGDVTLRVGVAPLGWGWIGERLPLGEFMAMGVRLRSWPSGPGTRLALHLFPRHFGPDVSSYYVAGAEEAPRK
jgi:SAM-dependent methyltransferase